MQLRNILLKFCKERYGLHQGYQANQLAWYRLQTNLGPIKFPSMFFCAEVSFRSWYCFLRKISLIKTVYFLRYQPHIYLGYEIHPCRHTICQNCMFFCLACALFSYLLTAGNVKCGKTNKHFFNPFPTNAWKYKNYHQQQFLLLLRQLILEVTDFTPISCIMFIERKPRS